MSDKSIYTEDGTEIPWMENDYMSYLDKSTLVFGASGSGKTKIVDHIMYLLRDHIPNVMLIAPQSTQKQYEKRIPSFCMCEDLNKEKLESMWKRQGDLKQIYDISNDIDILESVFRKCQDKKLIGTIDLMRKATMHHIIMINRNPNIEFSDKNSQRVNIEDLLRKKTMKIYKDCIRKHKNELIANISLNVKEKIAVIHLDINPRILIIIDDCSEKLKGWQKMFTKVGADNVFEAIFYRGRWNLVTLIIAAHDDKMLETEVRKNPANTIWTTNVALNGYISRSQSGFSTNDKKLMSKLADRIFTDGKIKKYQKMVYVRESTSPLKYMIADLHDDFKFAPGMWEIEQYIPKVEKSLSDNQFLQNMFKKPIVKKKTKRE